MSIDTAQLETLQATVGQAGTVREAAAAVRTQWPGLKALVVDAMDMRHETPTATLGRRKVYLASTDGHCWAVTADPAQASAVILTED